MGNAFKAVMVVVARQVGKSTMLKHLAKDQNRIYVTMDDIQLRTFAQSDPKLFLQTYQPLILVDEAQTALELFEEIKIYAMKARSAGSSGRRVCREKLVKRQEILLQDGFVFRKCTACSRGRSSTMNMLMTLIFLSNL